MPLVYYRKIDFSFQFLTKGNFTSCWEQSTRETTKMFDIS